MIVLLTILTADNTTSTFISILRLFCHDIQFCFNNSQCKLRPHGLPWFLVQSRRTRRSPILICLGELHPHRGWVGSGKRTQDGCSSTHWSKHWRSFLSLQMGLQGYPAFQYDRWRNWKQKRQRMLWFSNVLLNTHVSL